MSCNTSIALSEEAPNLVENIKLNCLTFDQFLEPDSGQEIPKDSMLNLNRMVDEKDEI